jgi:hypothetical protein
MIKSSVSCPVCPVCHREVLKTDQVVYFEVVDRKSPKFSESRRLKSAQ